MREGDEADAFYVLVSGSARVVKRAEGRRRGPAQPAPAAATPSARSALLTDAVAQRDGAREQSRSKRAAWTRGVFRALSRRNPEVAEAFQRLVHNGRSLELLPALHSAFAALPAEGLGRGWSQAVAPVPVAAGELVIREGDPPGSMYVIEQGRLRVFKERDGAKKTSSTCARVTSSANGRSCSERAADSSVEATQRQPLARAAHPSSSAACSTSTPSSERGVEERAMQRGLPRAGRPHPARLRRGDPAGGSSRHEQVSPAAVEAARELDAEVPELEPLPPARRRRRRRLPHVYQLDEMDCGAACLAMICRHFGKHVSARRASASSCTRRPTGRACWASPGAPRSSASRRMLVRASKSRLDELPLPAVVPLGGKPLGRRSTRSATSTSAIGDPATRHRSGSRARSSWRSWTGYAALFAPHAGIRGAQRGPPELPLAGRLLAPAPAARWLMAIALAFFAAGLELSDPDPDPGRRRPTRSPTATQSCSVLVLLGMLAVHRPDGRRDDRPALPPQLRRGPHRHGDARLPHRAAARAADELLHRRGGPATSSGGSPGIASGAGSFSIQSGVEALTSTAPLARRARADVRLQLALWRSSTSAVVPLYALLMRYSAKRLRPMFDSLEEAYGRYASQQIDAIRGIETVKALAAEEALPPAAARRASPRSPTGSSARSSSS